MVFKKSKRFLIFGIIISLLSIPFSQSAVVLAKEQTRVATTKHKHEITTKNVLLLANEFNKTSSYVQRGGDYKKGEYKTFSHNGKKYRYLSSSIDTKNELISLLSKSLDRNTAEQFIHNRGIIVYKGKLAQVEADGGTLLEWEKGVALVVKSDNKTAIYRITVPVGNSTEKQMYFIEFKYVEKVGWRISKEPKLDTSHVLTEKMVLELSANFAKAEGYIQSGGLYRAGEYKTFNLNGKIYRFLSSDIDTKNELLNYLTQSMTLHTAEQMIKDKGIIEYQGKLAQVEADGGSLLQWQKAKVEFIRTDKNTSFYRLIVPVGITSEKQMYIVEFQYVDKNGWRVSKNPYLELNVPGNINPVYIFFNYLLVDSKVAKNQFLPHSTFNVDEFKKGIKKVEFIQSKEIGRDHSHVEFLVKIKVDLATDYKGSLKNGENTMYFSVQPTGYMEFKIDKIGIVTLY